MTTTDPAADAPADNTLGLEGFEEALLNFGNPTEPEGAPEPTQSVETSDAVEEPAAAEDPPAKEPEASEDPPATEQTVNFDGFSDDQKANFERLLKDGHVTPAFVENERVNTLRQDVWTKKTMALAEERKAWEAKQAEIAADLENLEAIRSDPRLHDLWMKFASGEIQPEDQEELVDRKSAAEVARAEYQRIKAEEDSKRASYDAKRQVLDQAAAEVRETLGVSQDQLLGYLKEEIALLPPGTDPILAVTPEELQRRVIARHEISTAKAEADELRKQLQKRTSHDARTAKQSFPPARQVASAVPTDPLSLTEAELGLDPDWSNVTGFGFPRE